LAATFALMHHDGILVHLTTRFFDSGIRDCQVEKLSWRQPVPSHRPRPLLFAPLLPISVISVNQW
jgi:hypothetical protein